MNKIYRIVFNTVTGRWVVASEMAKGRKKSSAGRAATVAATVTMAMGGMLTAASAMAVVAITKQAVGGTSCEANADDGGSTWSTSNDARCHPAAGTGASGVGNPGTNIVMYSSTNTSGQEDSIAVGGYLDVWKTATFNEDGTVSAPTYYVTNVDGSKSEVHDVGGAVSNLDNRVYNTETKVTNLTTQINNGEVGLVKQDASTREITIAKDSNGTVFNVAGTAGDRTVTGVAAAKTDNDAVNLGQLKAAGVVGPNGESRNVVAYDNAEKTSITMGGEGAAKPVAIHNVAEGVADHDVVNVAQLNQRLASSNTSMITEANSYTDQRVDDVWNNLSRDIDQVNRQANRGIAAASALVNVTPYLPGRTAVNAGLAGYRGEAALGVGVSRWSENGRVNFNAGVSAAKGDSPVIRVGVGYVF